MARIRKNFFTGTLSSQLTAGATTIMSSALASFDAVTSPDVAYLVIDPNGTTPEIVKITAHTASSTSATIVRGQDSTTDRTWAAGTTIIQAPIASDYVDGPGFRSSSYYATPTATVSAKLLTNEAVEFVPFPVGSLTTFDRIACEVTAVGNASSVIRLGIYDSTSSGVPGDLVVDAGTVAGDSTGAKEITISEALAPGLYWLCMVAQNAASTAPTVRSNTSAGFVSIGHATLATATANNRAGYYQLSVSGALNSTATPNANGNANAARVLLRAA